MKKYKYVGETIGIDIYEKELNNFAVRLIKDNEYEMVTLTADGEYGYFKDEDNRMKRVPMNVMEKVA